MPTGPGRHVLDENSVGLAVGLHDQLGSRKFDAELAGGLSDGHLAINDEIAELEPFLSEEWSTLGEMMA